MAVVVIVEVYWQFVAVFCISQMLQLGLRLVDDDEIGFSLAGCPGTCRKAGNFI